MAPVPAGVEVTDIKRILQAGLDARQGTGNFPADKGFTPDRRLMVEQDSVAGIDSIGFAIINRYPVGIQFGNGVWRTGIKRRGFLLGDLLYFPVLFRGRCLV